MWQPFRIRELEKLHHPSSSFQFGITMAIVFAIMMVLTETWWLGAVTVLLLVVSFLRPQFLDGPNRIWFLFGLFLSWLMSPLFLFAFYYFVFSPMAMVLKLFGHKAFVKKGWVRKAKPCQFTRNF